MYIKLLFRNCSYGPLRAPSTLGHICQILKLSVNASPTLVSLDRAQPVVIVDLDQEISSGVWELMATDATDTETRANATVKPKSNPHRKEYQHRVEPMQIMEESRATPLSDSDLSACISALVSLISSIPARYIKYNSKLSLQITQAHAQVSNLVSTVKNGELKGDYLTFVQYKIMHVLTSTWKCVWQQFSPYTRSFSPSSIYSAQGLETAETLCNRLWEWRRLVSISDWRRLTSASAQVLPPLPSGRHPEAYTYLATHPLPQIQQRESKEQCLFRIELVQAMVRDNVHSDAQIERLISLLSERHQGDMRSICHTMRREFLG